ncbi:hypothetical protein D3C75_703120 [compost metagenome]
MCGQVQFLDHALSEGARLEQLELGQQIFVTHTFGVVDLFDGDNVGCFVLDQQGAGGAVGWGYDEGPQRSHHHDDEHQCENAPLAPPEDLPYLQYVWSVICQTLGNPVAFSGTDSHVHFWEPLLKRIRRNPGRW